MADITYRVTQASTYSDVLCNDGNTAGINNVAAGWNSTWVRIGNHPTAAYRPIPGFIFTIPAELAGVDPNTITDCFLEVASTSNITAPTSVGPDVKLINGSPAGGTWPTSFNSSNNPRAFYNADSTVTPITWADGNGFNGAWVAGTYNRGPNLAAHLRVALNAGAVPGVDKITVICKGTTGANSSVDVHSFSGTYTPRLAVTVSSTNQDAAVTPAPARVDTSSAVVSGPTDVDYHDGIGSSNRRWYDLYYPDTPMPSAGYPLVIFIHGGTWQFGTEDYVARNQIFATVKRGYAIASIRYKITNNTSNVYSHPHPVQDVIAAIHHLSQRSDIDQRRIIVTGYSAGGNIGLEAVTALKDQSTYTWTYTGAPSDSRDGDGVDAAPSWRYTQGRVVDANILGLFLWDSPHDVQALASFNPFGSGTHLSINEIRAYFGVRFGDSFFWSSNSGEAQQQHFLNGTAGTIYEGRVHRPKFPIGYAQALESGGGANAVVNPNGGINPLKTGLNSLGYTTTPTATGLNLDGGLSHYLVTVGVELPSGVAHEVVYPHFPFETTYGAWLSQVEAMPYVDSATVAATPVAPTISVTNNSGYWFLEESGPDEQTLAPGDGYTNITRIPNNCVAPVYDTATSVSGGQSLRCTAVSNTGSMVERIDVTARSEQHFTGYFKFDQLPTTTTTIVRFDQTTQDIPIHTLRVGSSGQLNILGNRDSFLSTVATTGNNMISAGYWYEIKFGFTHTSGYYVYLRVKNVDLNLVMVDAYTSPIALSGSGFPPGTQRCVFGLGTEATTSRTVWVDAARTGTTQPPSLLFALATGRTSTSTFGSISASTPQTSVTGLAASNSIGTISMKLRKFVTALPSANALGIITRYIYNPLTTIAFFAESNFIGHTPIGYGANEDINTTGFVNQSSFGSLTRSLVKNVPVSGLINLHSFGLVRDAKLTFSVTGKPSSAVIPTPNLVPYVQRPVLGVSQPDGFGSIVPAFGLIVRHLTHGITTSSPADTSPIVPTNGAAILLTVGMAGISDFPTDNLSVSGLGLTWNKVATTEWTYRRRLWLYIGTGVVSNGVIHLVHTDPYQEVGWIVDEVIGIDHGDPIVGQPGIWGDGNDLGVITPSADAEGIGQFIYSVLNLEKDYDATPEVGWNELGSTGVE